MGKTTVIVGGSFAGIKAAWDLRHLLDPAHHYSQYMSDGDVMEIQLGPEPYESKIRFEQIFLEKRGDIGELHHQMIK